MNKPTLSLVTCSYGPDLERCRTLCASVARYVDPSIEHVLIVPRRDRKAFAALADERTRVVTVESILPIRVLQLPWQRRWWATLCSPPVRGWIMQQLTKIAAVEAVDTDAVVFADSDVVFVRSFDASKVFDGGKLRLHRVQGPPPKPTHQRWHRVAGGLLGLAPSDWYGADYIGQLVTWRCDTVRRMTARITETTGRHWAKTLCNTLHFSEYILYGVFVEHVLAGEGHWFSDRDICHCSWHYEVNSPQDVQTFLDRIEPYQVAVLVQSNLGIDPGQYIRMLERVAERASDGPAAPAAVSALSGGEA